MFRQYGGLFSQAEKELALKHFTISKQHAIERSLVQKMGEPVVVPIASKEELLSAPKEELLSVSQEESKQFASFEESQNKGSIPAVVVPIGFGFI